MMKYTKLMKERIRRVKILFKELGYDFLESEIHENSYSAGFELRNEFQGGVYIDRDSKFLEIAFSFSFSSHLGPFIQEKLEDMLRTCYEFGCYLNLFNTEEEIAFSVFSKIYFVGLNYYSLKETVKDFQLCVEAIKDIIKFEDDE